MRRWSTGAVVGGSVCCLALLASAATSSTPVGAAGITLRVTPSHGLVAGQSVAVTGRGLDMATKGDPTWFVAQCTAAVRDRMDPATDTPHCDITHAEAVRVSHRGTFTVHYRVVTGIIGDGYCGTVGHASCVIVVGTSTGQGAAATITFRIAPATTSARPTT